MKEQAQKGTAGSSSPKSSDQKTLDDQKDEVDERGRSAVQRTSRDRIGLNE